MIDTEGVLLFLFDADGTLRRCTVEGQPCPNKPGEWELMPNVKETLARYDFARSRRDIAPYFGVVSNQGGVGLGLLSPRVAFDMLAETALAALDGRDFNVLWCPHKPDYGCVCRKPSPYLIFEAMDLKGVLFPRQVLYVGDRPEDEEAARRAGVRFYWAADFFSERT
jgi:D-glycero-D-manno-heptose 1,7-bisphosphate phosphatase